MTKKNTSLEKIAKKVMNNMNVSKNTDHGIDPITILMVISIILTLIRVIQECKKNRQWIKNKTEYASVLKKDIQDIVLKDSWLNRRRLQKIVKQNLTKDQYKVYGSALQTSIMETGVNLTDDEVQTIMEAENNV